MKGKRGSRVTEHDKAILKVKTMRDNIKRYQIKIEQQIQNEHDLIITLLGTGKREKALCLMKKKKAMERQLNNTDAYLENIEGIIYQLELKQLEQKVLEAMEIGNEALRKINQLLTIRNIENLLNETTEGIKKQQEINDMIASIAGVDDDDQDLPVEQELEKLIQDYVDEKLPMVPVDNPTNDTEEGNQDQIKPTRSKQRET